MERPITNFRTRSKLLGMEKIKPMEKQRTALGELRNPAQIKCNYKKPEKSNVDIKVSEKVRMFDKPRTALGDLKNQCQLNVETKKNDIQKVTKTTNAFVKPFKASIIGVATTSVAQSKITKIEVRKISSKDPVKLVEKPLLTKIRNEPQILPAAVAKIVTNVRTNNSKELNQPTTHEEPGNTRCISEESLQADNNNDNRCMATAFEIEKSPRSTIDAVKVKDIDTNDFNNPLLVSDYVNDIYAYLHSLEMSFAIEKDHLNGQKEVTYKMRSVLIDWINDVHCQFNLVPETYYITVSIIDRYLQAVKTVKRNKLQLVGVVALYIASKYEELYPPDINDFVYITDYTYSKEIILEMEKHILQKLDFNLSMPLTIQFLKRYTKAAETSSTVYLTSKYFIELATLEYHLTHYRPSEIAAASIYLALILIKPDDDTVSDSSDDDKSCWTPTLQYYANYTVDHLEPLVKLIGTCVLAAPKAKLQAIYKKYKLAKFTEVSTNLNVEKLSNLLAQL